MHLVSIYKNHEHGRPSKYLTEQSLVPDKYDLQFRRDAICFQCVY